MDNFKDSRGGIINIITKVLLPLGFFLITVISFWTSATAVPTWAYWTIVIYLAVSLLIILVLLAKNIIPNTIIWFSRRKFAMNKRSELQEHSNELNELLGFDRSNTNPYFISHLSSKLSNEVNVLNMLNKDVEQFKILQSWAWSLSDNLKSDNHKFFLRDATQFSRLVSWLCWACLWARQFIYNSGVHEKVNKDAVSEWNVAAQKISDFTARVERIMKSINNNYKTGVCLTSFQDVKQL